MGSERTMSGVPNLEGMTREARRNTILEMLGSQGQRAFDECYMQPEPEEATHMLKRNEIRRLSVSGPELEANDVNVKQIVEAMVWFNRDIGLFKGRPLSLFMIRQDLAPIRRGAENVWHHSRPHKEYNGVCTHRRRNCCPCFGILQKDVHKRAFRLF